MINTNNLDLQGLNNEMTEAYNRWAEAKQKQDIRRTTSYFGRMFSSTVSTVPLLNELCQKIANFENAFAIVLQQCNRETRAGLLATALLANYYKVNKRANIAVREAIQGLTFRGNWYAPQWLTSVDEGIVSHTENRKLTEWNGKYVTFEEEGPVLTASEIAADGEERRARSTEISFRLGLTMASNFILTALVGGAVGFALASYKEKIDLRGYMVGLVNENYAMPRRVLDIYSKALSK